MSTKHKPTKNQTGAVMCRLGAANYIAFQRACKQAGVSASKLAAAVLTDYTRRLNSGEIVIDLTPRKP